MGSQTKAFEGSAFRSVFEGAPDASIIVDEEGMIVLVNEEAERLLGYRREELIGRPVEELVPETAAGQHAKLREVYMEAPTKRPMGMGRELFARRRDGVEVAVEIGLSPVDTPAGRFILAVIHDITERRRLRAFGAGLLQGAEEERQRIARDLHDDTAQTLAALVLRLQMARRSDDPETRDRLLKELHEDMHRASAGVRRILRGLRPPLLEDQGLAAAVRSHVKSALAETDLEYSVHAADLEHLLTREARLALYRIAQEAVSNVVRHAEANRLEVRLRADGALVQLDVEDDGVGFDQARHEPVHGRRLGLVGIMERAAILGGFARIRSAPGEGTLVSVEVPAVPPDS